MLALMLSGSAGVAEQRQTDSPRADRGYVLQAVRDTWRYFEECQDPQTHLVWDHAEEARANPGQYTSITNIAFQMSCTVAAQDLGIISRRSALKQVSQTLSTLERLQRNRGFFYNFYDTRTLKPLDGWISCIDNAWLGYALIVVRQEYGPELGERASALLHLQDYWVFYDPGKGLLRHGFHFPSRGITYGHYLMFCSEPRAASLLAIAKGDVPAQHWFRMARAPEKQDRGYNPGTERVYQGTPVRESFYVYQNVPIVPSWGGSQFEFLMPRLFVDEGRLAPGSLGENGRRAVDAQIAFAHESGMPVWGMSPCADPEGGYGEYGVAPIGAEGYPAGVVTPHASFLALDVRPKEAIENLRVLEERFRMRGRYGFRDSVAPATGKVSSVYLALDQGMSLIAAANWLRGGSIRNRVMRDPLMKDIPSLLAAERFY